MHVYMSKNIALGAAGAQDLTRYVYASAYYNACVMCPHTGVCVLILLCVRMLLYVIILRYVSGYWYVCADAIYA